MAGVGFELKKLFKYKGFLAGLRGYFISTIVTVGPTILCVLMLVIMNELLKLFGETYANRQLFSATMVYCYAFSLIVTGGFAMLAARYVSDCIYEKSINKIFPSLLGMCTINLSIAFAIGISFLIKSELDTKVKILSYLMYAELVVIWIQAVYLSAVKQYLKITAIFFTGIVAIISSAAILVRVIGLTPFISVLFSMSIGFGIMLLTFFVILYKTFETDMISMSVCFEFLKWADRYWELIVLGVLFYLGLYGHNFIFWMSREGTSIEGVYRVYPAYDLSVFYAFITIIPSMVIFVVKVETSFYSKFKEYYHMVIEEGSINDIKRTKDEMVVTLSAELRHMIEIQCFISFTAFIIGLRLLPAVGFSMLSVDMFSILTLASLAYIIMYLFTIVILYFDDRKGAMMISVIFCLSSIVFTYISTLLGETLYGYGFFFSALISMFAAISRLNSYISDIEYNTFGRQPIFVKYKVGILSKFYNIILRLEDRKIEKKA